MIRQYNQMVPMVPFRAQTNARELRPSSTLPLHAGAGWRLFLVRTEGRDQGTMGEELGEFRSIPACAGETIPNYVKGRGVWVYPRMRGGILVMALVFVLTTLSEVLSHGALVILHHARILHPPRAGIPPRAVGPWQRLPSHWMPVSVSLCLKCCISSPRWRRRRLRQFQSPCPSNASHA